MTDMQGGDRYGLKAFTLVEMLVTMILSAIVFWGVAEGFVMMQSFMSRVMARTEENIRFYEDYCRLEDVVSSADSIMETEEGWRTFSGGEEKSVFYEKDSSVIVHLGDMTDTVFKGQAAVDVRYNPLNENYIDTVTVTVRTRDDSVFRIDFSPSPLIHVTVREDMAEKEKEYKYE